MKSEKSQIQIMQPSMERKSRWCIWILIILIAIAIGVGLYFWLGGGGIPQPPALPD